MASEITTNNVLPDNWSGSTYRNSSIKSYEDLANRIKIRLGAPLSKINATDEAIANNIDEAIDLYSRYAGYDREYVLFCDDALDDGCSIRLDEIVTNCQCQTGVDANPALTGDVIETEYVSGETVETTLIGNGVSLIDSGLTVSATETTGSIAITYEPTDPWSFEVCDANSVTITPLESYPPQESLSPVLDVWVKVENGIAEFYPISWEDKDPCISAWEWWGVDETLYPDFDPSLATHLVVTSVPNCTVEGLQTIILNTGKGGTFNVLDRKLDTCGYITASIEFVNDFALPEGLVGTFDIDKNTGFKLVTDNNTVPDTANPISANVEFNKNVTTLVYDTRVEPFDIYQDRDRGESRKISGVFEVAPMSSNNFGIGLFSFEYIIAQQTFGYNGSGGRNFNRYGYDIVTHELSMSMMEMMRERFGGGNKTSFDFNPTTQRLKIFKNRSGGIYRNGCYLLGINLERSISQMISETWVQDYSTALTKIIMGNTLTKFGGSTIGGLQINGNDLLAQGLEERKELSDWLKKTKSEGGMSTPFYVY
jgi:hypothetical protein